MTIKFEILLLILTLALYSKGQSLQEILQKHYDAVGIEYLKEVETINYSGIQYNHFLKKIGNIGDKWLKPDFSISVEKNKYYLLKVNGYHGQDLFAYNNGEYWQNYGGGKPEKWNASAIDRLKIQLFIDFEGFLYDSEKKGYKLTKYEDVFFNNVQNHKVRIETPENDTLFFYLSSQNYLISRVSFFGDLESKTKRPSFTYSNYKRVGGIRFPFNHIFRTQMFKTPEEYQEIVITKIKLNPKFDYTIFEIYHRIETLKKQER